MGMWNKDREYAGKRLDRAFPIGTPFVLIDAYVNGDTIPTEIGDAEIGRLVCCPIERVGRADTGEVTEVCGRPVECYTVASAIVAKIKDAEPEDFPVIAELERVRSKTYDRDALVLSLVDDWTGHTAPAPPARRPGHGKAGK